jgi:hypothetical protein
MAIPFSFLVTWAKVHKNEDRSLIYVNTLEKKNTYQTVEDILSSPDNGKKITDLRNCIQSRYNEIQNAFLSGVDIPVASNNSTIVLGDTPGADAFVERLKAFVKDYLGMVLNSRAKKTQAIFSESFIPVPFHTEVPTDEGLAKQLEVSGQNIRDHRKDCVEECRRLLIDGINLGPYCAESSLIRDMTAFKSLFETGISYETARRLTGISDDRTLNFLAEVFRLDITDNASTIIPAILPKGSKGKYSEKVGRVIDFFRDDPVCLRYSEDIVPALMRITNDAKLIEVFKSVILNSDEFVKYQEKGQDYIALRWDLLYFLAPRVCWILFNQKAFDLKSAVPSDRIVTLYNSGDYVGKYKGEVRITREQIRATQLHRCWRLMNIGYQEHWMIKESKNDSFDIKSFAANLQSPGMSYAQYIQAAKDSGLMPIYPESTVANYYKGSVGGRPKYDWPLLLNEAEALLKSKNAPLKSNDIVIELYHRHKFSSSFNAFSSSFLMKIKNETARFIRQSCDSPRDGVWVGLPDMVLPESYRTIIKRKAVELLLKAPNYTMNQRVLYTVFEPYVPDDLVVASALSSIFGDKEYFIKNGEGRKGSLVTITLNPLLVP